MVKVLITGAKGQVGTELVKLAPAGFTVIGLGSDQLNITNQQQVAAAVAEYRPSLIINAAAYTAVDKAESNAAQAFAVNEQGVAWLAEAAQAADIPLFHISTDYVFDGNATIAYQETAAVNPQGVYGVSKLAGEQVLAKTHSKHIILRTSWVFGAEGSNFVKTMLRLGKERDELTVVADQYGCPTSAASIAQVLWQLAKNYQQQGDLPWGIYNFSNSPRGTWHDFAVEIFKQGLALNLISKLPEVKSITTADYPTPAKRPAWSVLDCTKIETLLGYGVPCWKSELVQVLKDQQ
ncbi:MAG TPA: dTDP-4-dehydrorhamnose reductase [Marinospirillum sp.]|uniref:dTDP-4-dehydrorhamnose reductase n=1 Tax=Marinospirillum sp. TaxID=2183934 RepID=UPI002B47A8E6|nr:dTDP-4-dehydrorhamnose reductase [Marinospirillum sp.]HKM14399.1 dTDP-4-dehydrorhamnose reductase [Marinospirillum sp.]